MANENKQSSIKPFLDVPEWWEKHWQGMPEFVQEDQTPYKSIFVHFENKQDMKDFAELVKQKIGFKTQSIWYPKVEREQLINKKYVDGKEK